jgi:hypothetical protein
MLTEGEKTLKRAELVHTRDSNLSLPDYELGALIKELASRLLV